MPAGLGCVGLRSVAVGSLRVRAPSMKAATRPATTRSKTRKMRPPQRGGSGVRAALLEGAAAGPVGWTRGLIGESAGAIGAGPATGVPQAEQNFALGVASGCPHSEQ